MKKIRESWSRVIARARQESAKKTHRQVRLILPLVCVLVLGGVSASLAKTTTCGAPESCIITVFIYCAYPYTATEANTTFSLSNVDTTCNPIIATQIKTPVIGPTTVYDLGVVAKLYFDGTRWATNSVVNVLLFGADGLALSSSVTYSFPFYPNNDASFCNPAYVFEASGQLYDHLPGNCSDLPSQKSNTPNPDLGKPECPQLPLN